MTDVVTRPVDLDPTLDEAHAEGDCPEEGVDSSYVSRMVNLTTLAPDIVAAIFDETLPPDLTLFQLAVERKFWEEQRGRIGRH